MIFSIQITAQSSFGLNPNWGINENTSTFNNFENNPGSFSLVKDWQLSLSYGGEFSKQILSNIYSISLSKSLSNHLLSARYTPGYQKEFIFSTGETLIFNDSTTQSLEANFSYKELFGLGYSYIFSEEFNAGFTFRYFTQEFNNESYAPVEGSASLQKISEAENLNFWKGDIGLTYNLSNNLSINLSSVNLLNFGEKAEDSDYEIFDLKRDKEAIIGISYNPFESFNFNFLYETNNSFQTGINNFFAIYKGKFGIGINAFHDEFQKPFLAGISPALSYSSDLFTVSLSGVKYFSDRNTAHPFSEFRNNGINNIIHNRYSYDKIILSFSFKLNTIREKSIKFLDVEITKDIYPALNDYYIDFPFAAGKIINLTDMPVTVKPASKIEGINEKEIQSPNVTIPPNDTSVVLFYTIIPANYSKEKIEITYADFYLYAQADEHDDQFQKAILINNKNAWDGNVINLKYFIKKDIDFSLEYSRNILNRYKSKLDTVPYMLSNFYKSKIIFNSFVKELIYTSDPRASAEYVQYPHETIKIKGGDCDDLSVCYSSLLESVGIESAFVDYREADIRHVNVLINTGLSPEQALLITNNDSKYFIRKNSKGIDEIWLPIETTSLTDFEKAWEIGANKFNDQALKDFGLAKGEVEIIDIY